MHRSATYRVLGATALLWVFLLFFLSREAHFTFGHDHVHLKCAAQGATKHLHSPEYAPQDCILCHFNFQEYFEVKAVEVALQQPVVLQTTNLRFQVTVRSLLMPAFQQRGPPALPVGG